MTTPERQTAPLAQRRADEVADPERARVALAWAAKRADEDPGKKPSESQPPPRPEPADWRSLDITEVRDLLDPMIVKPGAEHGLEALHRLGFLDVWLPEVASMVGFGDGEWRHKDVWKHTKQVVRQSVPRLAVRWGALLHDIGKPRTRKIDDRGRVTFHGHAEVGARMFRRKTAERMGFEGELGERIHFLILQHLRPSQYEESWTDSAVRRFHQQMGAGLTDLLDLSRADITTKRPEKRKRGVRNIADLRKRVEAIASEDSKVKPLPKGLGKAIMNRFEVPPSKRLGDLMKQLEDAAAAGDIEGQRDFEYYLEHLAAHRERYVL